MLYGIACLHYADVWVEAGEDNAAVAAVLQYAGQDDVQEGVHVEVGRQVLGPRTVLLANTIAFIHRNRVDRQNPPPHPRLPPDECAHLVLTDPFQLDVETHVFRNGLENLHRGRRWMRCFLCKRSGNK